MSDEAETLDLSPSKDVYQAVKSDVTPLSAIKELIDNALDNWERISAKTQPLRVDVEYLDDSEELVIRDDSGGVEPDDISILFALGASKKAAIPGAIGSYGIGAKKAIVNLGDEALIKSRHHDADEGVGFRVDEAWLNDESNWTVDKEFFEDIDPGVTEIRISELNIEAWDDLVDPLRSELSHTYQLFLGQQAWHEDDRGELTITVDSEELTPPEPINWSFTPFDGLFPRRYENIELSTDLSEDNFPEPVYLSLTVGLLQKGDERSSGTDVYCQNRQVLRSAEDERAGYGELGIPTGQHKRLRVILEFETEGDAERLPWDTQKNDINPYNPLAQKAYDWVRRAVEPYFSADHESVPQTFLRPYDQDSEFAANHGEVKTFDYHGRKRVTDKADESFPEISELSDAIQKHVILRIYCTSHIKAWQVPAYELELQRQFYYRYEVDSEPDIDLVELPPTTLDDYVRTDGSFELSRAIGDYVIDSGIGVITDPDPGLADFELPDSITDRIKAQAKDEVICGTLKNWQLPSYLFEYTKYVSESTRPTVSSSAVNPYESPAQESPRTSTEAPSSTTLATDTTSSDVQPSTTKTGPLPNDSSTKRDGQATSTNTESNGPTNVVATTTSGSKTATDPAVRESEEVDKRVETGDEREVRFTVSESVLQTLRDELGLASDTPEDEVIRALIAHYLE